MVFFEGKVVFRNGVGYIEEKFTSKKQLISIMEQCQIKAKRSGKIENILVEFRP